MARARRLSIKKGDQHGNFLTKIAESRINATFPVARRKMRWYKIGNRGSLKSAAANLGSRQGSVLNPTLNSSHQHPSRSNKANE
jgi:hypothetical protein